MADTDTTNVYTCLYEKAKTQAFDRKVFSEACGVQEGNLVHNWVLEAAKDSQTNGSLNEPGFFRKCALSFVNFVQGEEYQARKANPCASTPSNDFENAVTMVEIYSKENDRAIPYKLIQQANDGYNKTFSAQCSYDASMNATAALNNLLIKLFDENCEASAEFAGLVQAAETAYSNFNTNYCNTSSKPSNLCESAKTSLDNTFVNYEQLTEYKCTGLSAWTHGSDQPEL